MQLRCVIYVLSPKKVTGSIGFPFAKFNLFSNIHHYNCDLNVIETAR